MDRVRTKVASRLGGAEPEPDDALPDAAESSETRQSGSMRPIEIEPEKEEGKDRLQAWLEARADEFSSRPTNSAASHATTPSDRTITKARLKYGGPSNPGRLTICFDEVQETEQNCELQTNVHPRLMEPFTPGCDEIESSDTSGLVPDQVGDKVSARKRNPRPRHKGHESPGADDSFAAIPGLSMNEFNERVTQYIRHDKQMQDPKPARLGVHELDAIPNLSVDEVKEREMQNVRHGKQTQNPMLAKWEEVWEDDTIEDLSQRILPNKHGSTKDDMEREPQRKAIDGLKNHRVKARAPQPPGPDVGDVLVAVHNFTARTSDELTLAKGDEITLIEKDNKLNRGWFLGRLLSNGDRGLFPEHYAHVKLPKTLAMSEDYPTFQTKLRARDSDSENDLGPDIVEETGPKTSAGPVCGSCGARWDPGTGCSRSCSGAQDGSGVPQASRSGSARLSHDDYDEHEVALIEDHPPPASIFAVSDGGAESSVGHTGSKATYSAVFSESSRAQPTDPSSWLDSSLADRAGTRGRPVETKGELDMDQDDEDCSRSISSVADSIGSATSTGGSLGQAGVNYVVAKFTQSDPELLALYTEASQRLTKDRFIQNNRRLLKRFYLDFASEDQTSSQREAVAFLRSRRRRAEISWDIFRTVTPDYDTIPSAEEHRKEFSMLNAYFEALGSAVETKPALLCPESPTGENGDTDKVENDQNMSESDESEVGDGEDQPSLDMTSLQAIGEYFVTSQAFSQYKQRLRQFLHPDQGKEHGSAEARDAHHDRAENPDDDQIEGTRNRAEEYLAERRADDTWSEATPENFQEPSARSSQVSGRRMPWERDSFATWVTKWVTDTLWPPSKGSQRIWYLCGCGQHTYMDIRELEPGGAESEWRSISESSAAATWAHSLRSGTPSGGELPAAPAPVHLNATSSRATASTDLSSQEASHTPQQDIDPASAVSPGPSGTTTRVPLFLLICINGKAYKTLAELRCLDIDDSYNDDLLIRGILDQYEQARKGCQWTIDLLLPTRMLPAGLVKRLKNMWENVPVSVRRPSLIRESFLAQAVSEWWNRRALDISPWAPLHIIDTADFVEFELVPHPEGKEAFPSHFTTGCWPDPDNKQYRYRPVPMKCTKTMNLWHMRRPGPHTEVYWYNTVPKKVDGVLYRPSGTVEDVVGYGVRINERLNDVLVLWWSFIFILATGLFIYVYSRCTSDNSSAFGLGAYLVAAFTVYIQLQYAWWKRS